MSKKQKYYVVWDGASQGVFCSWEACEEAVHGFPNARYKSFKSQKEAEDAFEMGAEAYYEMEEASSSETRKDDGKATKSVSRASKETAKRNECQEETSAPLRWEHCKGVIMDSIAVDAACSGNPGMMEYRGVYLKNGREIFHYGPVYGTNNIGEFLALVHGLALLKQKGLHQMPVYSDSVNAQIWVRQRRCKTTLARNERTAELFLMIERAEKWLRENAFSTPIIKWRTEEWGEIPADFGRK